MYTKASENLHHYKKRTVVANTRWRRNAWLSKDRRFENISDSLREAYFETHYKNRNAQKRETIHQCTCSSDVGLFNQFCKMTSLHGLRFVGDSQKHILDRLFWLVAFILALVTAMYYIDISYEKWNDTPVIMSIGAKATHIKEIPFPAVTICTMNPARKFEAEKIRDSTSEEEKVYRKMLLDFCNVTDYKLSETYDDDITENWSKLLEFMTRIRQPCHEMVMSCFYSGQKENCTNIFNPSLTDEGICCSFNKAKRDYIFRNPLDRSDLNVTYPMPVVDWTPESGYPPDAKVGTLPWRPRGAGSHLGLTLLLDADIEEFYCSTSASKGFKLLLHSPIETPKIADYGSLVAPGREYRITIKPTIINSSKSLRYVNKVDRQCVFSTERYLKFYRTYTQKNCLLECEANFTLQVCKCVPFYLPKDVNTPICGTDSSSCTNSARKLLEMIMIQEIDINGKNWTKPHCDCLPGCSEISYSSVVTYGALESEFVAKKGYLPERYNIPTVNKNLVVVHLFFTETRFLSYEKTEFIGVSDFLSTTGGLLGLLLGFSVVSAVEIVYFVTVEMFGKIFRVTNSQDVKKRNRKAKKEGH